METLAITAASIFTPINNTPQGMLEYLAKFGNNFKDGNYSARLPHMEYESITVKAEESLYVLLTDIIQKLPPNIPAHRVMFYNLIPSPSTSRAKFIRPEMVFARLESVNQYFLDMAKFFGDDDMNMLEHLLLCMDLLLEDEFDAIIFGGVDSFTESAAIAEYNLQLNPYVEQTAMRYAEGGAYILLERTSLGERNDAANILSLSFNQSNDEVLTPQEFYKDIEHHIWRSLSYSSLNIEAVDAIIHSGNFGPQFASQWRKLYRYFWPKKNNLVNSAKKSSAQSALISFPLAKQPEVIECMPCIGWYGIANLPMQLAMSYARLQDRTAPIENMLYLCMPPEKGLGVICLSNIRTELPFFSMD